MALSKPLTEDTRRKLTDFVEAFLESLKGQEFDERTNAAAKKKGIVLLQSDVDVSIVMITAVTVYSQSGIVLVRKVLDGHVPSRLAAGLFVGMIEKGREIDIGTRQN